MAMHLLRRVELSRAGLQLDAAIRAWRKVQACVSGSEISTIDESGVRVADRVQVMYAGRVVVLVGANVWYSTASGLPGFGSRTVKRERRQLRRAVHGPASSRWWRPCRPTFWEHSTTKWAADEIDSLRAELAALKRRRRCDGCVRWEPCTCRDRMQAWPHVTDSLLMTAAAEQHR